MSQIFFKCPICLNETCSISDHDEHISKCLKPCPKCKSDQVQHDWDSYDMDYEGNLVETFFIHCLNCGVSTMRYTWGTKDPMEQLVREWNSGIVYGQ